MTGAPFDQVSTVIQDQAGFIWIGSQNGLYRFDGVHFETYSIHTKSQSIHQLSSRDENLFFINDLGIYQIINIKSQPHVNPILEGSINETDELPFYPNDFIIDNNQTIWLSQANHSIGRLQQNDFKTYNFSKANKEQKLSIQEDTNGNIWVLSPLDGLFYFDKKTNAFEKKMDIKNGNALFINNDKLLIGNDALHIFNINKDKLHLFKTIELNDHDLITSMGIDHNNQYLMGTKKGKLLMISDFNQPLERIYGASEAHRVEALAFGEIYNIYITYDSTSNNDQLWVCSETGLWLLQERFFKTVNSLPMVNPISIAIGAGGKAWSPISYLYEISPSDDGFAAQPILNNIQVTAVTQDNAGFLWVSRSTPSVSLSKYKNNSIVKQYNDFHERGESIFNLYPDSKGNLWFCQAPLNKPLIGVAMITAKGKIKYYDETKGFSSRVLTIKESSRGEIYAAGIGEKSYLYRFDMTKDQFINLSPELPFEAKFNFEVHDLTIDNRGVVWLATTDGLLRYDGEKIKLIQNDILGQEEVRGVTHYSNNNIWIATATKGLVFHKQNTSTTLGEIEGLPASISAYRCLNTDAQGRLWAGTAEGLVYSRISAETLPYSNPPKIGKVLINQNLYSKNLQEELSIRKGQALYLYFTNLSYPAKNVEYQYRLLLKKDQQIMLEEQIWETIGNQNELEVNQMDLGNYYLELRARQSGGYQWSTPIQIQLSVFQPWYLQSWFVYSALAILTFGILYYFRFYVKRRFSRLQQVLNNSNKALANKEAELHQKIEEYKAQQLALNNANSNIQTLELFIKDIPKKASWNDIISAMSKAVHQAADIDAFEIAFKEENEIVHRGYSNQERSGYTFRSKLFNDKASLTCWAMTNKKEVLINDFVREHTLYIDEKAAYHFHSLLFIPFTLENDQPVVLCAYSIQKNQFDQNDLIMFRILAQFIFYAIHQEISKAI
jgi:ligand-binding sensor domain-containing protein